MKVFGPKQISSEVMEPDLCCGCGACVNLCPYFANHRGKTVMLFDCDRSRGRCHAFCPRAEVDLDELSMNNCGTQYGCQPAGPFRQVVAARAGRAVCAEEFQDGGTVSALMMYALESCLIEAAVLTGRRGLVPAPGLAVRPQEVSGFAFSKYAAAPTISSFNQGYARGLKKMGVVGTPCQITALAKMRTNPMENPDFEDPAALTIGLFCTWALDARRFSDFMEKRAPGAVIRKIRIPPPPAGVMIAETESRTLEIPLEDLDGLVPGGCRVCHDMTSEWADLSVGSLEGFDNWNTLIVRTARGERLMRHAVTAGYLETADFPETSLQHLQQAAGAKKRRGLERAQSLGKLNTEPENGRAVLRVNRQTLEKIISAYKGA